jgi:hypothetical protein
MCEAACAGRSWEWAACSAELRSKTGFERGLDNGLQHRRRTERPFDWPP